MSHQQRGPRRVILESPYAGDVDANVTYAREALADSLHRGEAPLASHLLYTQPGVLDDDDPDERRLGIDAGLAWGPAAAATVVYTDRGVTPGMEAGIARARAEGRPVEMRSLARGPAVDVVWHRRPYVGEGADGARRSAEIDRSEADGLDRIDPRHNECLASAARWEQQADDLERA